MRILKPYFFTYGISEIICINTRGKFHFISEVYKRVLLDKRFKLSACVSATKILPSLIPQTVNPNLDYDLFINLTKVCIFL